MKRTDPSTKKEIMGKVYRQFSRQKYLKYKAQFSRMRQSQIVSKIIKEWDALNQKAKDNLLRLYEEKNYLTNQDISSSQALVKSELHKKDKHQTAEAHRGASGQQVSLTKIYPPPGPTKIAKEDSDFNRGSEQKDDSRLNESDSVKVLNPKRKTITKGPQISYVTFYKQFYKRLHAEHPRWSSTQITSIIKLEWKKRKGAQQSKIERFRESLAKKPLSGRRFYRRQRRLQRLQAARRWFRFPYEEKVHWTLRAKNEQKPFETKQKYTTNYKLESQFTSTYHILRKQIK